MSRGSHLKLTRHVANTIPEPDETVTVTLNVGSTYNLVPLKTTDTVMIVEGQSLRSLPSEKEEVILLVVSIFLDAASFFRYYFAWYGA